ncbi:MAG: hypothetical protein ACK4M0_00170 [Phreatobacter sp.]
MPDQPKPDSDDEAALARLRRRIDDLQGRSSPSSPGPLAERRETDKDGKG